MPPKEWVMSGETRNIELDPYRPCWGHGTRPSSTASQGVLAGNWIRRRAARTPRSVLIMDVGVTRISLTECTTTSTPVVRIK